MVYITEELVRKKSEHNEGIIGTLEELSLHQEDIERIEHLHNWCKELQILYLQANLIPKIEHLDKLKKLEYLNLAINNIEKIENLEKCESLEKLDLTLNFIGDLESVKSLKKNVHLKYLYLTGNPCCEYEGYREYVIAHLPKLISLDQADITISERIRAQQILPEVERNIKKCQEKYKLFREVQKENHKYSDSSKLSDEIFWKTASDHSPETRIEISKRQKKRENNVDLEESKKGRKMVRLFTENGRPLNVNQAKLDFTFSDEDPEKFLLDVAVYKYLDTNLIHVDLQPLYVTLTVKGKVFQLVFPEEIYVEKSEAKRSQITGHLVLNLPRVSYKPIITGKNINRQQNYSKKLNKSNNEEDNAYDKTKYEDNNCESCIKHEYLEVDGDKNVRMDISKIVENNGIDKNKNVLLELENPDIPPLEYADFS